MIQFYTLRRCKINFNNLSNGTFNGTKDDVLLYVLPVTRGLVTAPVRYPVESDRAKKVLDPLFSKLMKSPNLNIKFYLQSKFENYM